MDGPETYNKANLQVNFYDTSRRLIGDAVVARWSRSFPWKEITGTVRVPETAREAILRLGLNGGDGAALCRRYQDDLAAPKMEPCRPAYGMSVPLTEIWPVVVPEGA